ncbi:MAG: ribonuclease HI [Thermodesulfobacteriota bacterium]
MPHSGAPVRLYTDGACLGNPGPGGWGAVLLYGDEARKELSGGFAQTTNNRMEMLALIEGLKALTRPCRVQVWTDSRYLHDGLTKGWLRKWQQNGWQTAAKKPVKNKDLWQELAALVAKHHVDLHWVRGHSGDAENERCDVLAKNAAKRPGLPPDTGMNG